MNKQELEKIANEVRKGIVFSVYSAKSGHPGGSLSCADILTYLYYEEMKNIGPENQGDPGRDRFVLSKGHAAPALYSVLAEKGYFDKKELGNLRHVGANLQGHPDMHRTPGVDMSTGSLGQGISTACGMALAGKIDKKDYRVFTLLGDGELEEGEVWEAAMFASAKKLDNLVAIVDNNDLQIDGRIGDVNSPYPIADKFEAFGFNVALADGHDFDSLKEAFDKAKEQNGKPWVIVCKTIKGKGVSFMEDQAGWHGKAPNDEEFKIAMDELESVGA